MRFLTNKSGRRQKAPWFDAMGHRIAKHISSYGDGGMLEKSIYYVLDAQGNVMSTYERLINDGGSSVSYTQTEKHIYGSSRLGVHTERIELLGTQNETYSMESVQHHIGAKNYELSNHLGNVLSVVSDKVIPQYEQEVVYSNDFSSTYAPFYGTNGNTVSLSSGRLKVDCTIQASKGEMLLSTIQGVTYRVYYSLDVNSSGNVAVFARDQANGINSTINFHSVNTTSFLEFTATNSSTRIIFENGFPGARTFYIDDVTIENLTVTGYLADIRQSTDYSPFGVKLHNRDLELTPAYGSISPYRYSFQGQEHDDEIKGDGNSINFEYRMHDPRLGRFFAIDPLAAKYPQWTPYQFGGNQVISSVELEGLEPSLDVNKAKVGKKYEATNKGEDNITETNYYKWIVRKFTNGTKQWIQTSDPPRVVRNTILEMKLNRAFSAAKNAVKGSSRPPWMVIAEKELGTTEDVVDGEKKNTGTKVEEYLASTGTPRGNPWCGAFVNWCIEKAGLEGTKGGAVALNWRDFGTELKSPAVGAIVTMKRKGGGHVGFVAGKTASGKIVILGGNQGDSVSYMSRKLDGLQFNYPEGYTPNYNLPILTDSGEKTTY